METFKKYERIIRSSIVIIFGASLAILLLVLCFYNQPSADDFTYAVNVRHYGFFSAQWFWYVHWCGRYFSTLLLSLNPLVLGSFTGYKIMSALLIILFLVSCYFFAGMLFNKSTKVEKLYIVAFLFIAYNLLMPSIAEAWYWIAGAWSYQTGNILSMLLFVLVVKFKLKPTRKVFLLSILVVAALAGTNEFSMLFMVLMLLFITMLNLFQNKKLNTYYLVLCISAILFSSVVYFAPGNAFRASFQINKHQWFFSLQSSVMESFDVLSHWWWIGGFLILTGYFIAAEKTKLNTNCPFESIYLNPLVVILYIFFTTISGFFTCHWSLGFYPPMRTINVIYFYFILGSLYAGICMASWVHKSKIKIPKLSFVQILLPLLLMVYFGKFQNNIKTAYSDLYYGVASRYNNELSERNKKLLSTDDKNCGVSKLKNIPKTIYFKDITENNDEAAQKNYSAFFNKDSIFIQF